MTIKRGIPQAAYIIAAAVEALPEVGPLFKQRAQSVLAIARRAELDLHAAHLEAESLWSEIEASGLWSREQLDRALIPPR